MALYRWIYYAPVCTEMHSLHSHSPVCHHQPLSTYTTNSRFKPSPTRYKLYTILHRKMPSYAHGPYADPEEDLFLLHFNLRRTSAYFEGLRNRLWIDFCFRVPESDTVIPLLAKTEDVLAAAARACGAGDGRERGGAALALALNTCDEEEKVVVVAELTAACAPLREQIGPVQQAWTALLERTDRARPNALLLAVCLAAAATETFLAAAGDFLDRVVSLLEQAPAREQSSESSRGRGTLLPPLRHGVVPPAPSDWFGGPPLPGAAAAAAAGRAAGRPVGQGRRRGGGDLPLVHPSRRALIHRALDGSRRARPTLPLRRRRRVCLDL